jgi:hypothetical protein
VSQTPGKISSGFPCTTKTAPVASIADFTAMVGLASSSLPGLRRLRKMPGATWMRDIAEGDCLDSACRSATSPPVWSPW